MCFSSHYNSAIFLSCCNEFSHLHDLIHQKTARQKKKTLLKILTHFFFICIFPSVISCFLLLKHQCTKYLWSIRCDELNHLKWYFTMNVPAAATVNTRRTCLICLSRCFWRDSSTLANLYLIIQKWNITLFLGQRRSKALYSQLPRSVNFLLVPSFSKTLNIFTLNVCWTVILCACQCWKVVNSRDAASVFF